MKHTSIQMILSISIIVLPLDAHARSFASMILITLLLLFSSVSSNCFALLFPCAMYPVPILDTHTPAIHTRLSLDFRGELILMVGRVAISQPIWLITKIIIILSISNIGDIDVDLLWNISTYAPSFIISICLLPNQMVKKLWALFKKKYYFTNAIKLNVDWDWIMINDLFNPSDLL